VIIEARNVMWAERPEANVVSTPFGSNLKTLPALESAAWRFPPVSNASPKGWPPDATAFGRLA